MARNIHWWRRAAAVAAAALLVATEGSAEDITTMSPEQAHVRSTSPEIVGAIQRASQWSGTFRRLVETIQRSDSYVYLMVGDCGAAARGCFVSVIEARSHRLMIVEIDPHQRDLDLMATIAHELRHTIEVIEQPSIRSSTAKFHFYERIAFHAAGGAQETRAAMAAGDSVRSELRKAHP